MEHPCTQVTLLRQDQPRLECQHGATNLLDRLYRVGRARGRFTAYLVGFAGDRPDRHRELVDRLPQRLVLS